MIFRSALHVALLGVFVCVIPAVRAGNQDLTTITVPNMHCMGCAKKMAGQLQAVPGVAGVQANVPATAMIVSPKPQQAVSPRALWEAIEKAGYKPSRLEGPGGTFTSKPQS
jgi:Cu+-exporting ATPase